MLPGCGCQCQSAQGNKGQSQIARRLRTSDIARGKFFGKVLEELINAEAKSDHRKRRSNPCHKRSVRCHVRALDSQIRSRFGKNRCSIFLSCFRLIHGTIPGKSHVKAKTLLKSIFAQQSRELPKLLASHLWFSRVRISRPIALQVKISRSSLKSRSVSAMKGLSRLFQAFWLLHSKQARSILIRRSRTSLDRTRTMPNHVEPIGDGHDGCCASPLRRSTMPPRSYFGRCRQSKISANPTYGSPS